MPRILLVDDDDPFREMLKAKLGKFGHQVVEARNGREALSVFECEPPELVLLDLVMPEMEGLETMAELRRRQPGVKVIAMSGGGRVNAVNYLSTAKALGATDVLAKPFTDQDLKRAIGGALQDGDAPGPAPGKDA